MTDSSVPTPSSYPFAAQRAQRGLKEYLGFVARGFAMGSSDVVPGVSGGTMAFILGIYEELIESIRAIAQPAFVQSVLKLRLRDSLQILNWPFLVSVFTGILLAILTLARGLAWLLENQPVLIWSFFFGLVLASIVTVSKRVSRWSPPLLLLLLLGAVGAYLLVGAVPAQTPETWWFLIISGALAICAMILPGISGAFILVLLGKYQFVLDAVNQRDIVSLALVAGGAAVGIISFAQILGWLFKRYHNATVAALTGLMLGSLRKIWPWKITVESMLDRHGKEIPLLQHNVLPQALSNEVMMALALAVIGAVAVLLLDRLARHSPQSA
ncbi:MAG: DUF368 domain-containing protein [Chloroflexi bacterium]|nr:DUF368 domain-containing protein [Chloroflexota bacterium]